MNAIALLVPLLPLTATVPAPGVAPALIVKVAVICVALATFTLEIAIPGLLAVTLAPETKLNPVMVTPSVTPVPLLAGDIAVIYGVEASTVLEPFLLVPAYVPVKNTPEGFDGSVVVIENGALADPAGTMTFPGTPARPGFELDRFTVTPP